ncbi:MAG: molecular chaperone HtpG [Acholeplasmatales bacterium]|nr:molecular chaperone HtpG [Acholeplasmatales bacterium]
MSETKKFKTETKRLLDLMINSIYTNKEIFLRELISNASDAIDKYHYLSLTNDKLESKDYEIRLSLDKENRTITISDNGIGMTHDELVDHLGTIAKSGSLEFMKKLEENKNEVDIIGQFGVGFYSAFMVAKKVLVKTKSPFDDKAYSFESEGTDSYKLDEIEKNETGTEITLYLRDNTDDENYDTYLEQYKVEKLVKKYSDYVRYPIKMMCKRMNPTYDEEGKFKESVETMEDTTLNSMIPLWKKNKSEVSEEELNSFYKQKFNDYEDPLFSMHINVEGNLTYNALIFIPKKVPYDLYSDQYEKGLQLYTKGVFIMDKCKELIPDYLKFTKGLVDSSDLSLNISREILQQNKQLTNISKNIEKKIITELSKTLKNDFDKYLEFFKSYGVYIKYGIYENFGEKKDDLKDLLIYNTINEDKMITLKEYVNHMKDNQKYIYYASGSNKEAVLSMPQLDLLKKKNYDCLILTDGVDEFTMSVLGKYEDFELKNINQGDLDILDDSEKDELKQKEEDNKDFLGELKKELEGKVTDVILSKRLVDSPVCLTSKDGLSFEMQKVLNAMPNGSDAKAEKVLEINPNHELFNALKKAYENKELADYADLLYNQALLMEGFPIENPVEFSNKMCNLMIKTIK